MPLLDWGSNTPWVANVDSHSSLQNTLKDSSWNNAGLKHREEIANSQEALLIAWKNDDWATILRTDRKGNIMTWNYIPELLENFEWATMNVQKWTATSTTFVPAQSTTWGYNFNNTNLTTANAVSVLQSQRLFYKHPRIPLQMKLRVRANIFTNSNADFGFGIPSTTTLLVPNGIAVRIIGGLWYAVLTFNNAELWTPTPLLAPDGVTQLSTWALASEFYVVDIIVDDDNAVVTVQNTQTGALVASANVPVPLSTLAMWWATALPVYARVWNAAVVPSTAPVFTLGYVQVLSTDWNISPSMGNVAGNLSLSAWRNPFTWAQLANHTNSTAPTSATLSNTAAWYTTLGGKFQFAALAGAVTDYALFGFQVPVGAKFLCEWITIHTRNTGAAVATTATTLEWAMWFNSSAVSLATANIVRLEVWIQSFPIGTAIEWVTTPIDVEFTTPEVVESGRFLHVILTLPVGTATASQIIRWTCTIKWRFI